MLQATIYAYTVYYPTILHRHMFSMCCTLHHWCLTGGLPKSRGRHDRCPTLHSSSRSQVSAIDRNWIESGTLFQSLPICNMLISRHSLSSTNCQPRMLGLLLLACAIQWEINSFVSPVCYANALCYYCARNNCHQISCINLIFLRPAWHRHLSLRRLRIDHSFG